MNPFDVFQMDNSLRLHFTQKKFDFFTYGTNIKQNSLDRFEKIPDNVKYIYVNVSRMREPKTFLIGNYIYNKVKHIRSFNDDGYLKYRGCNTNGNYMLSEDIKLFKDDFKENFKGSQPHLLKLYFTEQIGLYTLSVMERILNWTSTIEDNIITNGIISEVKKSYKFFKIDDTEAKKIIINRYK